MAKGLVNFTESERQEEAGFSELKTAQTIGPAQDFTAAGENVAKNAAEPTTIYSWKVMQAGDAGLKQALFNFIDTTKDGVKVAKNLVLGREKKMVFNFYGTIGKSIKPGEIGEFEVIFKYPPTAGGDANAVPLGNANS